MMSGTGNRAFTLLEVMVAVVILATGMIGIIRAYAIMIDALEAADYSAESVCILKEKMFEAKKEAVEEGNLLTGEKEGNIKGEYGDFAWKTVVTESDSSLEAAGQGESGEGEEKDLIMYLKEVKVRVSTEEAKPVRNFTLVGYVEGYENNVSQ